MSHEYSPASTTAAPASLNFVPATAIVSLMKEVVLALLLLAFAGLGESVRSAAAELSVHRRLSVLWQVQAPMPPSYPFNRYPAGKVFRGTPAPPRLLTADQRGFRTVLRNGAKQGPNFAGHFTVVEWGCGSNCIAMAVIDAITGAVYDQDMPQMNDAGICGAQYKLTSTLFVVETSLTPNGDCEPELYRWEGSHFVEVSEPR
jgi:hypothetical protein